MSRNRKDGKKGGAHRGGRAARSCKNHGGCPWCKGNRKHSTDKRLTMEDQADLRAFLRISDMADELIAARVAEMYPE